MAIIVSEKDLRMRRRRADGDDDVYYPITRAANVKMADGTTVEVKVNEHLADLAYQVAGGTATAITLTTPTLVYGYAKTFIASANNNGAATTINTKPLYKPNTTTAPTLIAGKAYTVWYSTSGNCFFIKASAEGNAVAGHVLAGDTFSNDNDTGLTGAMPNQSFAGTGGNYTTGTAKGDGSGAVTVRPSISGYYANEVNGGGFGNILASDPNYIPANILSGKSIFGVSGTAKRMASGTGTTVATNPAVANYKKLEVSGLSFTPSIVLVKSQFVSTLKLASTTYYGKSDLGTNNADGSSNIPPSGAQSYLTNGGFSVLLYENSAGYSASWIAIE